MSNKKLSLVNLIIFIICSIGIIGFAEAKPNWKVPLEANYSYKITCGYGGVYWLDGKQGDNEPSVWHTDAKNAYYAVDFDNPSDCSEPKIVATADGEISKVGYEAKGYGNYIYIDHGEGYISRYAHLKSVDTSIKKGVSVKQGQLLGIMGSTGGNSTGSHLHFVILYNGKCKKVNLEAKPEPLSGYTNIRYGDKLTSDNDPQNPTPTNGSYIKFAGNSTVYYVSKDQLWPIKDEATFTNMGNSDFSNVVEYDASQQEQITKDFPIKRMIVGEHLIAKLDCNPKVYRFSGGKWHCFSDWDVFTSWGYSDKDIVEIPQAVFNMYSEGSKLDTKAYAYIVPLVKEWNYSLGHSFADSIAGNSDFIAIEYQGTKVSISQAIANGWTYKTAYGYNNDQGFFDFIIKDGEFKSGTRYFIYSFVSGAKLRMYGILQPEETQAVKDMDKVAATNSKLSFKELYSLHIVPDWSKGWNLRVMSYKLSSSQTSHTWFNHATSKSDSSVRYVAYKDPDTGEWTSWQRVY
ncbi:MAG: M23 family metallopeptidase [bacterium]